MPFDSLHAAAVARELDEMLRGGRIDKITMPEQDEIVLFVHAKQNAALVLSCNPSLPRIHISARPPKNNPLSAPAFLMHLRKHIGGGIITRVERYRSERIVILHITARNELGYTESKRLICEILGKYANIILTDGEGRISECLKHVSPATSEKRPVLPGLLYTFPPRQNKVEVFDRAALSMLLDAFTGGKLDSYLLAGAAGLAPATITAIVTHALGALFFDELTDGQKQRLLDALDEETLLKTAKPCIKKTNGKSDFWLFPFYADGAYDYYDTLNAAMDACYASQDEKRRVQERAHVPKTVVKNAIARTEKKLKLFLSRKQEAEDLENDRLCGELITANIYRLKQGMKSFEAENYYLNPPEVVCVRLDESKSPQYNAQSYYKKYAKKKKTLAMVEEQIAQAQTDLAYYQSVMESFGYADEESLNDIITELTDAGLLHAPKTKKKEKPRPFPSVTIGDCTISWGKSNLQNDRLTKSAKSGDIWLHTQKIHGSHVIVSGAPVSDETLLRAAQIAAYYSQGRLSDKVPVDYTLVKNVHKAKGAPLGQVTYTDQKTLFVTPKNERGETAE